VALANHVIPFGNIFFRKITKLALSKIGKSRLSEHRTQQVHMYEIDLPPDGLLYKTLVTK